MTLCVRPVLLTSVCYHLFFRTCSKKPYAQVWNVIDGKESYRIEPPADAVKGKIRHFRYVPSPFTDTLRCVVFYSVVLCSVVLCSLVLCSFVSCGVVMRFVLFGIVLCSVVSCVLCCVVWWCRVLSALVSLFCNPCTK